MAAPRSGPLALGMLLSVLAVLQVALAGKAAHPQKAACVAGDLASCAAGSEPQSETLLVQLQGLKQRAIFSSVSASAATADSQAAAHVRDFFSDVVNAGKALNAGFVAVRAAVPLFTDGQVLNGLGAIANGILEAVTFILPSNFTQSAAFASFRESWTTVSEAVPGIVATVSAGVDAFREDGDVLALLRACITVINDVGPSAMQFLPYEVGVEIAKYLTAVEDALEGFEQGMEVYSTGNATDAIWQMYLGLRTAVGELLPEDMRNDENFAVVLDIVDAAVGGLSALVLQVKQQLLGSSACWKVYTSRERARPGICPDGHWFDGLHWCFAEGSSRPMQIKSQNGICASSQRGLSTGPIHIGGRMQMAACDRSSSQQQWFFDTATDHITNMRGECLDAIEWGSKVRARACKDGHATQKWEFVESDGSIRTREGGLCLHAPERAREGTNVQSSPCDAAEEGQRWVVSAGPASLLDASVARKKRAETVAATCDARTAFNDQVGTWCYKGCPAGTEVSGTRCRTRCDGAYPAGSPLMCARSYRELGLALQDIAAGTFKTGINAKSMTSSAGPAGGLQHTIHALAELGLSLTHPTCPQPA